jgi:hypothetical protein
MKFVAHHQSAEPLQPGEEPLHPSVADAGARLGRLAWDSGSPDSAQSSRCRSPFEMPGERVRRRTNASVGVLGKPQRRFQHSAICIRHLSPCPHLCFRRIASANSFVPPTTSNLKPKTTSTIYQTGSSVFPVAAILLPQLCILVVLVILCCLPTPLQQMLEGPTSRQMRRTREGGLSIKSSVAVFRL